MLKLRPAKASSFCTKVLSVALALGASAALPAQAAFSFSLERYVPTRLGEDSFWVDAPSSQTLSRRLSLGITGAYANNPLVVSQTQGTGAGNQFSIIEHEAIAHIQAAMAFRNRFIVSLDIPLVLIHRGNLSFGVRPGSEFSLQDVRIGGLMRLSKDTPDRRNNLFVAAEIFVPSGGKALATDRLPRLMPKLILTSKLGKQFQLSGSVGGILREKRTISTLPGAPGDSVGSEIQAGLRLRLVNRDQSWSVGPEILAATSLVSGALFSHDGSSIEILGAVHWTPHPSWKVGAALGAGLLASPGTPTYRGLLRVSFHSALPKQKPVYDLKNEEPEGARPALVAQAPQVALVPKPIPVLVQPPQTTPLPTAEAKVPYEAIENIEGPAPDEIRIERHRLHVPKLVFAPHRATLLRESAPVMMKLIGFLKVHKEVKHLVIEAYTDNNGTKKGNARLALLRARKIRTLLTRHGVAKARLSVRGMGEKHPLVANDSPEHRALNNRVVFKIKR